MDHQCIFYVKKFIFYLKIQADTRGIRWQYSGSAKLAEEKDQ
jgi:hypothetical protein